LETLKLKAAKYDEGKRLSEEMHKPASAATSADVTQYKQEVSNAEQGAIDTAKKMAAEIDKAGHELNKWYNAHEHTGNALGDAYQTSDDTSLGETAADPAADAIEQAEQEAIKQIEEEAKARIAAAGPAEGVHDFERDLVVQDGGITAITENTAAPAASSEPAPLQAEKPSPAAEVKAADKQMHGLSYMKMMDDVKQAVDDVEATAGEQAANQQNLESHGKKLGRRLLNTPVTPEDIQKRTEQEVKMIDAAYAPQKSSGDNAAQVESLIDDEKKAESAADPKAFAVDHVSADSSLPLAKKMSAAETEAKHLMQEKRASKALQAAEKKALQDAGKLSAAKEEMLGEAQSPVDVEHMSAAEMASAGKKIAVKVARWEENKRLSEELHKVQGQPQQQEEASALSTDSVAKYASEVNTAEKAAMNTAEKMANQIDKAGHELNDWFTAQRVTDHEPGRELGDAYHTSKIPPMADLSKIAPIADLVGLGKAIKAAQEKKATAAKSDTGNGFTKMMKDADSAVSTVQGNADAAAKVQRILEDDGKQLLAGQGGNGGKPE
jgi:hypothetical protein